MTGPGSTAPNDASVSMTDADVGRVRAVLALGGVGWEELDDGVQQVRLKLVEEQSRPDKPPIDNPAAWLSVVASRVAADWHRTRQRDAALRERLAANWQHSPPAGSSDEQRVLALDVADGLNDLTPVQRQVVALRYYADLPVGDIAATLGIAEGTVKSRLHSAVSALRDRLREKDVY